MEVLRGAGDYFSICKVHKLEASTVAMHMEAPLFSEIDIFLRKKGFICLLPPPDLFHRDVLFIRSDQKY